MTDHRKAEVAKLFSEITKTIKRSMRKSFAHSNITLPQSLVIGTLMKSGEMKISELSKKLDLSNSTISGILDRLEKRQFIVRTRSLEDRRIVHVKVSPEFEEFKKGMYKEAIESFEDLLRTGTPEEIETIIIGLKTLNKVLNDHPKQN